MKSSLITVVSFVFLNLVIGDYAAAQRDLRSVIDAAQRNYKPIHSAEFRIVSRSNSTNRTLFFRAQGSKFRIDSDGSSRAFNGSLHQSLSQRTNRLATTSAPVSGESSFSYFNPAIVAYQWLFDDVSGVGWTELRDSALWTRFCARASLLESEVMKGHRCTVLLVDQSAMYPTKLYLAEDLTFLPLMAVTSNHSGKTMSRIDVLDYRSFKLDGEDVLLPVDVHFSQFAGDGLASIEARHTIAVESIRLNHSLDESIFTLAPGTARTMNKEEIERIAKARKSQQSQPVERSRSNYLWIFLAIIGVLVALCVLTAKSYRSIGTRLRR